MRVISVKSISMIDIGLVKDHHVTLHMKRQLRTPLLTAFDIYKGNIAYGVITETEKQHKEIAAWYLALLNLEDDAFTNIPTPVSQYVRG